MEEKEIAEILNNIDRKLALILNEKIQEKFPIVKEQISYLAKYGFSNNEISEILGITTNYVSKELSMLRKRKNK